ncbi:MAG TPA: two-component regulator propeller domain-containing protein [Bacteroidia bacterium]|nr:two-component regulator propeller domain-containing protein [Bacteroidia bacterium]
MQVKYNNSNLLRRGVAGKVIVILLLRLFLVSDCAAQTTLPFQNFTVSDGLPSSEVYHAMQDSKGFMWFSTDHGVCRYDGYQFKTFTTADGLADNTIFECSEDYKGRIWFRSYSGRLSYYYHDSVFNLSYDIKLKKILNTSHITSLVVDSSDILYIGSHMKGGILTMDLKHQNSVKTIPLDGGINYMLKVSGVSPPIMGSSHRTNDVETDSSLVLSVYSISSGNSLLRLESKLPIENLKHLPLLWYEQAMNINDSEIAFSYDNKFIILRNNKIVFSYSCNSHITKLSRDKAGRIWILIQNGEPVYYYNNKIQRLPVLAVLKDKQLTFIAVDREGGLWVTSLTNGIYYLSSLEYITKTVGNGLPSNKINLLEVAPDSSLWISTSPGNIITVLNKDSLSYHIMKEFSNATTVNSILFHKDNTVWVGTGDQLRIYDNPRNFSVLKATFRNGEKDMIQTGDGSVWVNCTGDIKLFKRQGDSLGIMKHASTGSPIKKLLLKPDNTLWVGTLTGLFQYANDSMINLWNKFPVLSRRIADLEFSQNGDLWIATRDTGLIVMSKNHLWYVNIANGLVSNFSHCTSPSIIKAIYGLEPIQAFPI